MWNGENALVLMIYPRVGTHEKPIDISPDSVTRENRELKAILDTATDGVLMLDRTGRIIFANRSAEALFGYDSADFTEPSFGDLFAPESRRLALEHLDRRTQQWCGCPGRRLRRDRTCAPRRAGSASYHYGLH